MIEADSLSPSPKEVLQSQFLVLIRDHYWLIFKRISAHSFILYADYLVVISIALVRQYIIKICSELKTYTMQDCWTKISSNFS